MVFRFIHFTYSAFTAVKIDAKLQTRYLKRVPLLIVGTGEGLSFLSKMVKGSGVGPQGEASPFKTLLSTLPLLPPRWRRSLIPSNRHSIRWIPRWIDYVRSEQVFMYWQDQGFGSGFSFKNDLRKERGTANHVFPSATSSKSIVMKLCSGHVLSWSLVGV